MLEKSQSWENKFIQHSVFLTYLNMKEFFFLSIFFSFFLVLDISNMGVTRAQFWKCYSTFYFRGTSLLTKLQRRIGLVGNVFTQIHLERFLPDALPNWIARFIPIKIQDSQLVKIELQINSKFFFLSVSIYHVMFGTYV